MRLDSGGDREPAEFERARRETVRYAAALNAGGGRLAAERASGWTRQLRLTPLPSWAYAAGKTLIGVGLALAAAVVLALVAEGAARPDLPAAAWAELL